MKNLTRKNQWRRWYQAVASEAIRREIPIELEMDAGPVIAAIIVSYVRQIKQLQVEQKSSVSPNQLWLPGFEPISE